MTDMAYVRETEKDFDTVVANLEKQTAARKFRILAIHDVQKTLAEKGLEREPLKIVELCNAGFAHEALQKDVDVSLFMPCRYAVYTEGGKTMVKLARPSMIAQMLPQAGLEDLAGDVEQTLIDIMEASI